MSSDRNAIIGVGASGSWSRRKKDAAPRGVFRHRSGVWAARYFCGAGHRHQERVGTIKSEAIRVFYERRARAHDDPRWCPTVERRRARVDQARQVTFRQHAAEYSVWAKLHHRGWKTEESRITRMVEAFGDTKLDAVTPADAERFLDQLLEARSQSTRNRYRALLSAMFSRAQRHGLLSANPVKGITKLKEPEGRIQFVMAEEEAAILGALRPNLRALFTVSIHTGLRWSEQLDLEWRDVDFMTGLIIVKRSKSGYSRQVPMNSVVRSALMDLAGLRQHPGDPRERVFLCSYVQPDKFFPRAVDLVRRTLLAAGSDASRLDGYTWHCNRHTFASRLVMAGVDLRTVQVLGGWRTLAMVQRYSHLAPAHLREAVERLVPDVARFAGSGDAGPNGSESPAAESAAMKHERNLNGSARSSSDVS
jgi:integrase